MKNKGVFTSVPEYIAAQTAEFQNGLQLLRSTIRKAAPKAEEIISYNMPAYRQHSVLVYFAATKAHFGFYPTSSPMAAFKEELAPYKTSKGAIQFPLKQPIPVKLVTEMVKWRMKDDEAREITKKEKNAASKSGKTN